MGTGVIAEPAEVDGAQQPWGNSYQWPQPFDRPGVERRIIGYLHALGVHDRGEIASLSQQVLERVEFRAKVGHAGEPLEAAIEETHLLLDQWLVSELALDGDANALSAARAAVLEGAVPGWTARWAGRSGESLARRIRAARISSVPEPSPLLMEPNTIRLCCHGFGKRLVARIGRLLGLGGGESRSAGEHP